MEQPVWAVFYKELAQKLLAYQKRRGDLIEIIKSIFTETGIRLPTLERDNKIEDIDPFTVFGLFNKSSMREVNRNKIVAAMAEKFQVSAAAPTSYESIPLLNNQNATFYYFLGDREKDDIENLWSLFSAALAYAEKPTAENRAALCKYFDLVIQRKGNGNSKVTMGLYWIAPDAFLNLDRRNVWYIYESGKLPASLVNKLPDVEDKIPSERYFAIAEQVKAYLDSGAGTLHSFIELSAEAWRFSEAVNRGEEDDPGSVSGGALADADVESRRYWLYAPGENACYWEEFYRDGIMALGWEEIGDYTDYDSKEAMRQAMLKEYGDDTSMKNSALATWQFCHDIKPGDVVFAKRGRTGILGRGVVLSDYEYAEERESYQSIRRVKWAQKGEWELQNPTVVKTLTDITPYTELIEQIEVLFEGDELLDDVEELQPDYPPYSSEDFLEEVFMEEEEYDNLVGLLTRKKNVILQGAPGVGKTFAAKRLAYSMIGEKDVERVMMVQFHQSYSYEDFIMGIRPTLDGRFSLKKGVFYHFCKKAEADSDHDYFFIIDEINRGNLSKIFGELFMLIEKDKRGIPLQLLYSDEKFSVPGNVYIIGMMNTADRSLAILDYALRRRFSFYDMKPGFETEGFQLYRESLGNPDFDRLIECVTRLNEAITEDDTLGEGFCIGHSYFCGLDADKLDGGTLGSIVEYDLIPLLKEYWFDEPDKVQDWSGRLRGAIR